MIDVLRRGSRVILDYPGQYEELFSEAYTAARKEVKAIPEHAQMPHVRGMLEALREEERHLEEHLHTCGADPEYEEALMKRRHEVRAEAERTGRAWVFDQKKKMQVEGFAEDEIKRQMERQASAEELPRIAARRAAFEVASGYLARHTAMPRVEEVKRHSRKQENILIRRKRSVAMILLLWDADAEEYVRRPSWEGANAKDLFKKVAEQQGEEHLSGDTPANSIEDYFRRKLRNSGDFPDGGDMEGWFKLAREWAEDVPEGMFDPK